MIEVSFKATVEHIVCDIHHFRNSSKAYPASYSVDSDSSFRAG